MLRPVPPMSSRCETPWQLGCAFLASRDEVDGLAPLRRFVSPARRNHLSGDTRNEIARVLPSDQVETLEGFIDEIEGMPGIGKYAVGLRRQQEVGYRCGSCS